MRRFRAQYLAAITLVLALAVRGGDTSTPAEAQAALPPLPSGWPSSLQLGMADGPGGASVVRSTAPFGFRYQYLSGGVNHTPEHGWATWNSNGDFATFYIQDSVANGITPTFTYYMIRQSGPNDGQDDANADFNNLQNTTTMAKYYADVKLFMQKAAAFPSTKVLLHVEPDMWGFLEQRASGDNAATVPVQVSSTGMSELNGLPNDLSGFAQAVKRLRDTYAPNVWLGYHMSIWGTGNDILYSNPDSATINTLATRAGNYYLSLNTNFDVAFAEFSDRDADFKRLQYGDNNAWWDAGDFSRNQQFISKFVSVAQKRVVFWQIPGGNTRMLAENNTWEHYQDNKVEWLLDDSARTNLTGYLNAGVVAYLFGRGADGPTCFCDAAKDGVTNPPPINGNTRTSLSADDDGGFFRDRAANYYRVGAMSLPASGGPPPATSTPTALATATRTATATPTPPPAVTTATPTSTPTPLPSGGTQTVTFDDLRATNQPLNGQYPTGVIDWGTNAWFLSAPWRQFTTNSVGFNGAAPRSASFRFVTPRRLVQVDVFNGGTGASTVTLQCDSAAPLSVSVAANTRATIATAWSGTCSTVTVGSSNGWDTNFDSFVISSSTGSTATSTPTRTPASTPTSTPTRIATATPTAMATSTPTATTAARTLTFDDLSNPNRPLSGQYPSGVVDWGTNAWYLSGPFGAFRTNSIGFNGGGPTSGSFRILTAQRLVQMDAYNGGATPSTVTVSCAGQPTFTTTLAVGQQATLRTNWTTACAAVTVGSSNGWNTNFDNVVVQ